MAEGAHTHKPKVNKQEKFPKLSLHMCTTLIYKLTLIAFQLNMVICVYVFFHS